MVFSLERQVKDKSKGLFFLSKIFLLAAFFTGVNMFAYLF
jgi:hypothetical protein